MDPKGASVEIHRLPACCFHDMLQPSTDSHGVSRCLHGAFMVLLRLHGFSVVVNAFPRAFRVLCAPFILPSWCPHGLPWCLHGVFSWTPMVPPCCLHGLTWCPHRAFMVVSALAWPFMVRFFGVPSFPPHGALLVAHALSRYTFMRFHGIRSCVFTVYVHGLSRSGAMGRSCLPWGVLRVL